MSWQTIKHWLKLKFRRLTRSLKKGIRIIIPEPDRKSVEESPWFTDALFNIAPAIVTDVILDPVKDQLALHAEHFLELVPNANIRCVKTNALTVDEIPIPALTVWFTIYSKEKVLLFGLTGGDDEWDDYVYDREPLDQYDD